jgi:PAS domain-containing protein
MTIELLLDGKDSRILFDAMPSPGFVVDEDVRILDANSAALPFLGPEPEKMLHERGGDVLRCINAAESAGGCSTAEACKSCVIRSSVKKAITGDETVRVRTDMQLLTDGGTVNLHLLITVSPFEYEGARYALLILEDITELTELRRIIPICARCKKIRNDADYWEEVAGYLTRCSHLQFSHGVCPDCARLLYGDLCDKEP